MDNIIPLTRDDSLDLSGDFGRAFRLLSSQHTPFFITGKAGTGKSTLLRYFADNSDARKALLAPTGIAAVNIDGETIHSFFGFPPEPITKDHIHLSRRQELFKALDVLVVDEVSMVRADLMDGIDQMLRLNRNRPREPFGGVQMLFFGDLFQLEPIVSSQEEAKYFTTFYRSPFFFDAKAFDHGRFDVIDLRQVFRQKDPAFVALLDAIRIGDAGEVHLRSINARFDERFSPPEDSSYITLTSTNKLAAEVNSHRLSRLPAEEWSYQGTLEGDFPRTLPTDMTLTLKRGAQVMFVKNAPDRRWVNGTIGKIRDLAQDSITVAVKEDGYEYVWQVSRAKWEIRKHRYDPSLGAITTQVVGSFTQYPLKLAWGITIHKSQGLTFRKIVVDLGAGAFAHGQTYVALSRSTNFLGLVLKTRVRASDLIVNDRVRRFYFDRIISAA